MLQGVEVIEGRPVIYDMGNLLFDNHASGEMLRGGLFTLGLDHTGIRTIEMAPLDVAYGRTTLAVGNSAARTLIRFRDLSSELGTHVDIRSGIASIGLPTPPARAKLETVDVKPLTTRIIQPATKPPPDCVVESVPENAKIEPRTWGDLQLLGVRTNSDKFTERKTIWVETWWTLNKPMDDDVWIYNRMKTKPHDPKQMWWADHEHCDWMWPTSRWEAGQIIRDTYGVRPPKKAKSNLYELTYDIIHSGERVLPASTVKTIRYR